MKKKKLIKKIKAIIETNGSFNVGEVVADCSPSIGSLGRMVALAEEFYADHVKVNVYDPKSFNSDSIDSYELDYEELKKYTLVDIFELALQFKELSKEETA